MIRIKNSFFFITLSILLVGCVSIPRNTANVCSIFSDKYFWFKNAEATEKKWGAPIVTRVEPFGAFYPAEESHQNYLQKNPSGYSCHFKRELNFD